MNEENAKVLKERLHVPLFDFHWNLIITINVDNSLIPVHIILIIIKQIFRNFIQI